MKVDIIQTNSYCELEKAINDFLKKIDCSRVIDIKYSVSAALYGDEQIYCFSALLMYK